MKFYLFKWFRGTIINFVISHRLSMIKVIVIVLITINEVVEEICRILCIEILN